MTASPISPVSGTSVTTNLAEVRTFAGPDFTFIEVPGMSIDTISKYGFTLFADDKDSLGFSMLTPAGQAVFARRFSPKANLCRRFCPPPIVCL